MNRRKLLGILFFLMLFLFSLDALAQRFYWYYSVKWFDSLMHFVAGFWVGLFFLYTFTRSNFIPPSSKKILFWVLVIGVLWEIFEVWTKNMIGGASFDITDTSLDLFLDLGGGVVALFYYTRSMSYKK